MDEIICPYEIKRKTESKTLIINCRTCKNGNSTFSDDFCRHRMIQILQKEHGVDRLILNHAIVKVYTGEEMVFLNDITRFVENCNTYGHLPVTQKNGPQCHSCIGQRQAELTAYLQNVSHDPIGVFLQLQEHVQEKQSKDTIAAINIILIFNFWCLIFDFCLNEL